jgi:hypothetical protein
MRMEETVFPAGQEKEVTGGSLLFLVNSLREVIAEEERWS